MIETDRLTIYPASREQMEKIIAAETNAQLKKAYTEMLDGCLRRPDAWDWYAMWMIELKDGTHVGDLCFKGPGADGVPEIGYGILEEYQGRGCASEAVSAACAWAFRHPEVTAIEAETDPDNAASQRVLEKCGFLPNGIVGEEGPRFSLPRERMMSRYEYVTLREKPALKEHAAEWFYSKWGVPEAAYLECMEAYLKEETEYGWYLCLDGGQIVGGLGVIENDFHDRKDLSPNICAVFTEKPHRCRGIAGRLLDMAVEDLRAKGVSPVYLVTDHIGFYERYGWEFLCTVRAAGEAEISRMYIHR